MRFSIVLLLMLFMGGQLAAQQPTRKELEKRRASLLNQISETQQQLAGITQDRKATVGQLRAINSKLRIRESLISNINSEIGNINYDIKTLNKEIGSLNKDLDVLKMRYAESVRYAYKNKTTQSLIVFLFSADNFNDAIRRMQYLKKYRDYRKTQADNIRRKQEAMNFKIASLSKNKNDKANLLESEEVQKVKIQEERNETDKLVKELQGREGELMAEIRKNQQIANRIQEAIKKEIQKEIELARKKAEEEAKRKAAEEARKRQADELARRKAAEEEARKKAAASGGDKFNAGSQTVTLNTGSMSGTEEKQGTAPKDNKPVATTKPSNPTTTSTTTIQPTRTTPSYKLSLTPEVQALSESFVSNKGKLPWPVAQGFVSAPYGRHPHPVYSSVMLENNGIDIATSQGATVRSVFEGTVIKISNINGYVVMISHGEYFTVYTNLATVSVSAGAKVSTKQAIGTAGVNSDGENMLNFQIWKVGSNNSSNTIDPAAWIAK